ncbi:MAG: hypothetical protein CME64_00215 [Halobacteriovoraceae bacterium]|nr:hypothetical protein [Halobacteriovoraceae bacterium]
MKLFIICMAILTSTAQAFFSEEPVECRQAVVDARFALRDPIEPHAFASMDRKEFNMAARDFNALSTEEQKSYYNSLTPMDTIVYNTLTYVGAVIAFFAENEDYSELMADYVLELKGHYKALQSCI